MLSRILGKIVLDRLSKEGLEKAREDFGSGFKDYFSNAFGQNKN
jgi:hypothetical protein